MMLEAATDANIEAVVSATGTSKGAAILFQQDKLSEVSGALTRVLSKGPLAQQMKNYAHTSSDELKVKFASW